jgi:hypothetical protein
MHNSFKDADNSGARRAEAPPGPMNFKNDDTPALYYCMVNQQLQQLGGFGRL